MTEMPSDDASSRTTFMPEEDDLFAAQPMMAQRKSQNGGLAERDNAPGIKVDQKDGQVRKLEPAQHSQLAVQSNINAIHPDYAMPYNYNSYPWPYPPDLPMVLRRVLCTATGRYHRFPAVKRSPIKRLTRQDVVKMHAWEKEQARINETWGNTEKTV